MDAQRIKLIVKFLERIFQSSHSINSVEMVSEESLKVNWSQLNFRDNCTSYLSNLYHFNKEKREFGSKLNNFPIHVQQPNIQVTSPKGTYRAIVQQVQDKAKTKTNQVIEIYRNEDVISQINIGDMHDKILNDAIVGNAIVWNSLETKFLYIAQAKKKSSKSYFELEEDKDIEDVNRTYQLEQDFGEGIQQVTNAQLYEYDILSGMLYQVSIPEDIFPSNPSYLDEIGDSIILQGYHIHPDFKYGILHCFNRQSDILYLKHLQRIQLYPKPAQDDSKTTTADQQKKENNKVDFKIISQDEVSFKPIVSPDGKKIAYFGTPINPSHLSYLAMKIINISDWTIQEILPIRKENLLETGEFMGVCGFYDDLKNFFWLKDSKHFVLTSIVGHSLGSFLVNTETREICRFNVNECQSDEFQVIDYNGKYNTLFATHVNMTAPPRLAFLSNLDLQQDTHAIASQAKWQYISLTSSTTSSIYPSLKSTALSFFDEQIIKSGQSTACLWRIKQFHNQSIPEELNNLYQNNQRINPLHYKDEDRPLVVFIHGGPHASISGSFAINHLYFLLQGYNVLLPNYTGSAGYGQNQINELLTKIGDIDAKEILHMIDQVVDLKMCNPSKIIVMGGSYGGYMTGIMSSRYPERFLCAIMRNPVVNIPFTFNISDIPDWCIAESFGNKMTWNLTGNDYKKMFELSPMSLPNKVPTLNLLGAKDRRVPYQQSLAYHAQSVANGTEIETYIYPESDHALRESLPTIFDSLLKQIIFIEKHLLK